jgi:hypothetical protein
MVQPYAQPSSRMPSGRREVRILLCESQALFRQGLKKLLEEEPGFCVIGEVASGAELGHYKLPRAEDGTCTMHNFNFVPGVERDILVSAAYTGGTTVADLTNPADPVEIGFYRPGDPISANAWSSYWHNGHIYANDINRGLDVFAIDHPAVEGAATLNRDNPQTQERLFR